MIIQQIPNHILPEELTGKAFPFGEADMKEFENELLLSHDQTDNSSERIAPNNLLNESNQPEGITAPKLVSIILPATSNLIYIYDIFNHKMIYVSHEIFQLLGYESEQIVEMGSNLIQNILHHDDFEKIKLYHQKLNELSEYESTEIDYRIKDTSNNWHWVRSHDVLMARNNNGEATHIFGSLEVITYQKEAKIALIESLSLYADLVSNQSVGIYRMRIQKQENGKSILESTSMEFVSDRFCELLEVDKNEFLNNATTTFLKQLHPDDLQDFITSNELAQQSQETYIWEGRLLIGNSIKWLRFESSPRKFEDESICWTGVIVDITRQKLAEEAIRANEEKYRMLLELASDAFFQGDKPGNFLIVNSVAIQQTGYSRDELLKMNMKELFSDKTIAEVPLKLNLLLKGDIVKSERELTRKDGKIIIVEMNSRAMPDGTFQSFFRDITERKHTEKALKRKLSELEIYYGLAITRERKMIALKGEINTLLERLGEKLKY